MSPMRRPHIDIPHLLARYRAAHDRIDRIVKAAVDERPIDPKSPAGQKQLRGIPVVGSGGLDERQDPLRALLEAEEQERRDRERRRRRWSPSDPPR